MKVGKLLIKILSIKFTSSENSNGKLTEAIKEKPFSSNFCRFCHSASETENNVLINPCNCIGSQAFVHINCLRSWIRIKYLNFESIKTDQIILFIRKPYCEVCNQPLPDFLKVKESTLLLCDFGKNYFSNYFTAELERNQNDDENSFSNNTTEIRKILITNLAKKKILMVYN